MLNLETARGGVAEGGLSITGSRSLKFVGVGCLGAGRGEGREIGVAA